MSEGREVAPAPVGALHDGLARHAREVLGGAQEGEVLLARAGLDRLHVGDHARQVPGEIEVPALLEEDAIVRIDAA
jgi:hypothetical protein